LRRDPPTLIGIVLGETLIDGAEVGKVFILCENKPNLKDETIDLGVEFHSEERHSKLYLYIIE
jgi:hypothetical protein